MTNIKLKAQLMWAYYTLNRKKRRIADEYFIKELKRILKENYDLEEEINKKNLQEQYLILNAKEQEELNTLWVMKLKELRTSK